MSDLAQTVVEAAARAISQAEALLVTAGAGMGVDSGLPDFRGDQGFWRAYPPFAKLGLSFVDLANPAWFVRDPGVAWGFYGHRLNLYRATAPHAGFAILRRWGERMRRGCFVFTSNVDGHFQKAGFAEEQVVECHGSLNHVQCVEPCGDAVWPADGMELAVDESSFRAAPPLPCCPGCPALARPNVLMFGDWSWVARRSSAQEARLAAWLGTVDGRRLVVVELGAGSSVPTVRMTSEQLVRRLGATLIRINPREPQVPAGQIGIAAPALTTLAAIDEVLG